MRIRHCTNIVITDQGFSVRHNKTPAEEEGDAPAARTEEEAEGPEVPCDEDGNTTTDCLGVNTAVGGECADKRAKGEPCDRQLQLCRTHGIRGECEGRVRQVCPYMEGSEDYAARSCQPGLDEATWNVTVPPLSLLRGPFLTDSRNGRCSRRSPSRKPSRA